MRFSRSAISSARARSRCLRVEAGRQAVRGGGAKQGGVGARKPGKDSALRSGARSLPLCAVQGTARQARRRRGETVASGPPPVVVDDVRELPELLLKGRVLPLRLQLEGLGLGLRPLLGGVRLRTRGKGRARSALPSQTGGWHRRQRSSLCQGRTARDEAGVRCSGLTSFADVIVSAMSLLRRARSLSERNGAAGRRLSRGSGSGPAAAARWLMRRGQAARGTVARACRHFGPPAPAPVQLRVHALKHYALPPQVVDLLAQLLVERHGLPAAFWGG